MAKSKLGSGARFKALESKIAKRGGVRNPAAVAASIGRKKYGAKKFQALATKGKKHLTNDAAHGETIHFTPTAKHQRIQAHKHMMPMPGGH
jgi:hypothetical protein